MDSMEYSLSKFKNDIANQFGHNVFYNNVLIRVFYYLLKKRINTRILFLVTTYRRVLMLYNIILLCINVIFFLNLQEQYTISQLGLAKVLVFIRSCSRALQISLFPPFYN